MLKRLSMIGFSAALITLTVPAVSRSENRVPKVLDQETLEKMSDRLCTTGFKAYVGNDKKNVCQGTVNPPDIGYSCVWDKKGPPSYTADTTGPCNLDGSEHKGSISIAKDKFKSNPPLPYGTQVECCYRSASPSTY